MIVIEHFHGAASRVPVSATACTMRTTGFNVVIISQWAKPSETDAGMAWARQTYSALTPFLAPMRYLNYLEVDAADATTVAYGQNLAKLRELKKKYDPDNFFHHNVNITP
jgi:Berberine and berberine like